MSAKINEDLIKERKNCTFDVRELIHVIDGGEENTLQRKQVENFVLNTKELWDDVPEEYLSHKKRYENAIKKASFILHWFREFNRNNNENSDLRAPSKIYSIQEGIFRNVNPLLIHIGLFWTPLKNQASAEQQAEWLRPDSKMIGTYAQTELGHGSYLKGIETTATFDQETDEFILNSPQISSYKWWPGGLGKTANSCLVMAQLYISGTCHGLHLFLVQIRDYDTHKPLPGITVGEIGPKMGFNTADNGFLGFDNYRIPRTNLLMRNVQVLRDGTYVKPKHSKLTYESMVLTRVTLITDLGFQLSRAVTIAVRYSAVRHQSQIKSNEAECQILDFVTQQHKLFISIASSHALRVIGLWMWNTHKKVTAQIHQGNMDELPELHALACCLKAICSRDAVSLVEQCRLACGGNGYLMSSNLPQIYANTTAAIIYEGEYTVLLLQTARYLIKSWKSATEHKPLPPNVAYLADFIERRYGQWKNSPEGIIDGFKAVAAGKTKTAYDTLQRYLRNGRELEEAWNLTSVQLIIASEAYARSLLCDVFWRETKQLSTTVSINLATVLEQLAELYLVYWALEKHGDLLLYSTISRNNINTLQERYEELLALIRPNAVGLVDAFDIRDEILCSTLGAYDGRVYERMMEEAAKSPLNAEVVNDSFHKYMRPVLMKNKL
ncbi:acyl-coenzyme A oxidase 1-like [Maniola hyperantus]|uniref:acyl-coenzyme A oxidase 1-like n=1 Tax=Aphantopus hyperantus TaxID=2795564 RepID=UPI0015687C13|nr:probable peroxisomal acyl-coenzyme A oxidase 1 [Maniola hyperantus]